MWVITVLLKKFGLKMITLQLCSLEEAQSLRGRNVVVGKITLTEVTPALHNVLTSMRLLNKACKQHFNSA